MSVFTFFFLVSAGVFSVTSLYAGSRHVITGTTLYSFADRYYLVQTDRFIYRIDKAALPLKQIQLLMPIGAHVSFSAVPESIVSAWRYRGETAAGEPRTDSRPTAPSNPIARFEDDSLILRGSALHTYGGDCSVQVGDIIYKVKTKCESTQGPGVEIKTTGDQVDFAWNLKSEKKPERYLANSPKESVTYLPDHVAIRGRLLYSFLDPYYWVQSGNKIYQIRKSALTSRFRRLSDSIGSFVSLDIPRDAIDSSWKAFENRGQSVAVATEQLH